jgi:outer membrane protein
VKMITSSKAIKPYLAALVVLLSSMLFAGFTSAQDSSDLKIAVLDMNAALFNSEVAKQVDQEVRNETADDQQKVQALAQQAQDLQDRVQKDAAVMSDAEKQKAQEQLEEIGVQYNFLVQKIQKLVQERRQQFQQSYTPNLIQAITGVIEEGGYDVVLRSEALLHFANEMDVTARVTEKLNAQSPALPQ